MKGARQFNMLSKNIEKLLSEQLKNELYSAYLYMAMEDWFDNESLKGFENWYTIQVKEERDHARGILRFIQKAGGRPTWFPIEAPATDFQSIADILERTYKHEQLVTSKINVLYDAARQENDHKTLLFMQWYVTEQVEEEENCRNNINRLKFAESTQAGILIMDQELKERKYVAPQIPV